MAWSRWFGLDPKDEARLQSRMESLKGPARETARWIMEDEDRWGRLCWMADHYANAEPLMENWKDAEGQWKRVQETAQALNQALESLGDLAYAIRNDAGVRSPGLWERVSGNLHAVPGQAFAPSVHDLEWFAKVAAEECERMKVQCNGARREDDHGELASLFHHLFDLLEVPKRPQAHAQRIAAIIHGWSFPKDAARAQDNPRFGERAMKRMKAIRAGTQTLR